MKAGSRLLAVCYGGGHVAAVVPVVQELESRGWSCTTLALTTAREVAEAAGLSCIGFSDLLSDSDHSAREWGHELAGALGSDRISLDETVAYLGLSFADLADTLGEQAARDRYEERGRAAFLPMTAVERAVDLVQPSAILTTNSPRAERAALHIAENRNIRSVSILDLFGANDDAWLPDFPATTFCVLGQRVAERVVRAGAKPDNIVVTGNPAFDGLFDASWTGRAEATRTKVHGMLGIDARQVVLVALPPRESEEFMKWVLDGMPDSTSVLCFRQHPSTGTSTTIICGTQRHDVAGHLDTPLEAWLHASDLVISTGSTVSLQSVLVGTPTILAEGWGPLGFGPDDLVDWAPCEAVPRDTDLGAVAVKACRTAPVARPVSDRNVTTAASLVADVVERQ